MKILIHCLNYAPETVGAGKYSAELAESLAVRGHQVQVITSMPYYPAWKLTPGYPKFRYKSEYLGGVFVRRAPLWVPHFPGGIARLIHLLSFAIASIPMLGLAVSWRPDAVFTVAPTLLCAPGALLLGRITRAITWLHIQDYEVDIAFETRLFRSSKARRFALWAESLILKRFDAISTISRNMLNQALKKGGSEHHVHLLPNWTELDLIKPISKGTANCFRQALSIPDTAVVALYAGSMGHKQGVHWLGQVARDLAHDHELYFVFCGDGVMRKPLIEECKELSQVRFLEFQPVNKLCELLGMADIHLLPQGEKSDSMVMPSKLLGMLASGRPVLAMARQDSDLASILSTCGVTVDPSDINRFTSELLKLKCSSSRRGLLGRRARQIAESDFSKERTVDALERGLTEMAALNSHQATQC